MTMKNKPPKKKTATKRATGSGRKSKYPIGTISQSIKLPPDVLGVIDGLCEEFEEDRSKIILQMLRKSPQYLLVQGENE